MKRDAPACWRAAYHCGDGDTRVDYECDIETNECPVGLITTRSQDLLRIVDSARMVHDGSGGVLYGQDSGKWPCWVYDAVEQVEMQRREEKYERERAVAAKMRQR